MQIIGYRGERVDAVKILALRPLQFVQEVPAGANILEIGENHRHQILTERLCDDAQAESVIRLWNKLSGGLQDRCHTPGFGLQFIVDNKVVFSAALCWQCDNIAIDGSDATINWRVFDSRAPAGAKMLRLCEEVMGCMV